MDFHDHFAEVIRRRTTPHNSQCCHCVAQAIAIFSPMAEVPRVAQTMLSLRAVVSRASVVQLLIVTIVTGSGAVGCVTCWNLG